ncbi:MAG: heme-dependent peroxidase [Firmicutes bacterium]|nr:heme-dependent peroxidase [Bacillota bacterium]
MSEVTQTIEGWYALHDFRTIDWKAWRGATAHERSTALSEWTALSEDLRKHDTARTLSYGVYQVAGHKADLLFVHFRPTFEGIISAKEELQKTRLADYLHAPYSYVSIVELSSYLAKPGTDPLEDPRLLARLQPPIPENMPNICFYPMNKRREGTDNWYMLPMPERVELMKTHGLTGRSYAGKVSQVITGSVGFDDWEWGVTLYAADPLQFKKLVYEMRFDEVSARYADFGPFYAGTLASDVDVANLLKCD